LEIHPVNPQDRLIQKVVEVLKADGIIVYPTDTSYGLGCSIFSKRAVDRIYKIRNYDKKKKLSIVCHDIADISRYAYIDDVVYRNMKRLLPGPYTWILKSTKEVPRHLADKRKQIGIRIPDNQICLRIVQELGHPILSAGAGIQEIDLPGSIPYYLEDHYGPQVDLVIDGGVLPDEPSTVLKADDGYIEIVREGLGKVDFLSS